MTTMESVEEKFEAALNVIRSLPKNGSYKPSPEMMLKFYSYYKQATEGPCTKPKPWAWDVINKAKWDAWTKLRDMPGPVAMENYVQSLMKVMADIPLPTNEDIVESMPATDDVQTFVKILGNFYEVVELQPPKEYKTYMEKTSTPVRKHSPGVMNGNGHAGLNGHSHHIELDNSPTMENTVNGHPHDEDVVSEQPLLLSDSTGIDNRSSEIKQETDPVKNKEHNEVHSLPSDSEDEFCDTAEDVQLTTHGRISLESKDSITNSYTMVNSDDHMGSSSSAKSDSLSTLDETFDAENNNGNMTANTLEDGSSQTTMNTVKVRTRGGEYGTRGTDNRSATSQGRGGSMRHAGRSDDSQENIQSTGRRPQFAGGPGGNGGGRGPGYSYSEVQDQIATTLLQLQQDMNSVLNRLTILEALTVGQQARRGRTISDESNSSGSSPRQKHREVSSSTWWPFPELSPKTALFVILWPLVVRWILFVIRKRRQGRH